MAALTKLQTNWQQSKAPLEQHIHTLSPRDRLALAALMGFLVLFGLGSGIWMLHKKANDSQKAYDTALADVFWLRSQAGNINANQSTTDGLNKADKVRQSLTQWGITGQVIENGNAIQLSFSHSQPGVVNNIFNQLTQAGLTITQLQINQPSMDKLEVQAILN